MWSNDPVAAEDPDDVSPWTRDDWVPESAVPESGVFDNIRRSGDRTARQPPAGIFGEPPPEDFDDPHEFGGASRSNIGRKVVAGAIVLALLIGSAGALLRGGGDEPDDQPPVVSEPVTIPADDLEAATTDAPTASMSPTAVLVEPDAVTVIADLPAGSSGIVVDLPELPPPFEIGAPLRWSERTITVPEPLAAIESTEVITLTQGGIVSVTEFPSGRSRSMDASSLGGGLQLVVGDGAIVVFNATTILQLRDGALPIVSPVDNGVVFVESWTGTGTFILTQPATGPDDLEQEFVLQPDGTITVLDDLLAQEVRFWSRTFSPAGDVLVTRPGGVYAIDPDGVARRISTGDLLAVGDAHWAIEECDESLRCAFSVVSWETGEGRPGVLEAIESFGFIDPVTRISPDGRSVVYRSDRDGSGQRRILDVETGSTIDAGRLNQLAYPDAWAADSSGVFVTDRFVEFVDRATGVRTPIEDLERIRVVATEPYTVDG
jgi:hypothetical protein